jgi:hypothetical protein
MNAEFDLQRAINGEPFETVEGKPVKFVAYLPTARECKQLIIQAETDVRMYYANGRYHGTEEHWSYDLRMKTPLKQIDWAKLPVDTLLITQAGYLRYFNGFIDGKVTLYAEGRTSKSCRNYPITEYNPSDIQIAPNQPWTVWQGGNCPIPDGLEYEVITRGGVAPLINRGCHHIILWSYTQNGSHSMSEIIAYRLTGKVLDGWKL